MATRQVQVGWSTHHRQVVDVDEAHVAQWAATAGVLARRDANGARVAPTPEQIVSMMRQNRHFAAFLAGKHHLASQR